MLRILHLLTIFVLTSTLTVSASPPNAAKLVLKSLVDSEELHISEGLPHQSFESVLLKSELKREDTTTIGSYPFYTPKLEVSNKVQNQIRQVLGSQNSIALYQPKRCGGFHPDYAVNWYDEDEDYAALICFGCREVKFVTPSITYHYDLTENSLGSLKAILKPFRSKRPAKN